MQNEYFRELSGITKTLLEEPIDFGTLYPAIKDLKSLFVKASLLDVTGENRKGDIQHSTGKAIGTDWAALCVDDILRTKRFVSGTHNAIRAALKSKKDKPVTLLYIGTGPFATLAMPLTTVFQPEELQLVLVEINPVSLQCLKNSIRNFGIEKYVKEIIPADAAQLKIENPQAIDILLLECMQAALLKEQQVAITYNLLPQLREDVILVPQEIKVSACLVNSGKKMEYMTATEPQQAKSYYKILQPMLALNKQETAKMEPGSLEFPKITTLFSEEDKKDYNLVCIATEICVFDNQKLDVDQCSLTMMHKIADAGKMNNCKGITTQYLVNESPGWEITYLE